ncbi:MAG: hypothetical protein QM803_03280 [Rhodocyclaceae bacterium]
MFFRLPVAVCLALLSLAVGAEPLRIGSESRDAAAAYVGTQNFVVGRMARDCFEILGRSDTPKDFVAAWQSRNQNYYAASVIYMGARLTEVEKTGGEHELKKVATSFQYSVQSQGAATVADFFKKGEKSEVCKRVIGLIENKAFDITPQTPIFSEIEALLVFVATNNLQ